MYPDSFESAAFSFQMQSSSLHIHLANLAIFESSKKKLWIKKYLDTLVGRA